MGVKKLIAGTVLLASLLCPSMAQAQKEETKPKRVYGLSSFVGAYPNARLYLLHPYVGWKWNGLELGLEGVVGTLNYNTQDIVAINDTYHSPQNIETREIKTVSYSPQNAIIAGAVLNVRYDLFKIKKNKIFIGAGEGFSYWNKSIIEKRTFIMDYKVVTVINGNEVITGYSPQKVISEPKTMIMNRKIPRITQREIGLRRPFEHNGKNLEFLISARFSHTSCLFLKDRGVNTWGLNIGVRW